MDDDVIGVELAPNIEVEINVVDYVELDPNTSLVLW
jgi:hypothetical protein